jgi:hypothetical protein
MMMTVADNLTTRQVIVVYFQAPKIQDNQVIIHTHHAVQTVVDYQVG